MNGALLPAGRSPPSLAWGHLARSAISLGNLETEGAWARDEGEGGSGEEEGRKGTPGQAVRAQIALPSPGPSAPRDLETGGPLWAAGVGLTEALVPAAQQIPAGAEAALESGEDRGQRTGGVSQVSAHPASRRGCPWSGLQVELCPRCAGRQGG